MRAMHHDSVGDLYEPVHLCARAAMLLIVAHDGLSNIQPARCSATAFVPIRNSEQDPFSVSVDVFRAVCRGDRLLAWENQSKEASSGCFVNHQTPVALPLQDC